MSPIRTLLNRTSSFPSVGQIRKGLKDPTDPKHPLKDLTFFRVTFDEKETIRSATFARVYGPEPQEINILLPFDEIDRCWENWLEAYVASRLIARSDGERFLYLIDHATGTIQVRDGQPDTAHRDVVGTYTNQNGRQEEIRMKPTGRLKVVIPELQSLAYLTVHTTSIHDIINITAQLEAIKEVNGGRIAGIPLVLRRRPKKISTPNQDGSRARRVKSLLSIEADPEWVSRKLLQMRALSLPGTAQALLPEPEILELDDSQAPDPVILDDGDDQDWQEGIIADADQAPVEPSPEPVPAQQPAEPEKLKPSEKGRPYEPEVLKGKLEFIAYSKFKDYPASDKQRGLLRMCLEMCFAGDERSEDKRHQLLFYLTGHESTKMVAGGMVKAMIDVWLAPTKLTDGSGGYTIEPLAAREAALVIRAANIAEGQQELPL